MVTGLPHQGGAEGELAELVRSFLDPALVADGQGVDNPFRLVCEVGAPATDDLIEQAWPSSPVPDELRRLWLACGSARLFEDVEYGQWGLELLGPQESANRTRSASRSYFADDLRPDDVVVGSFIGDQELLVYAPGEEPRRRLLVAVALDAREEWCSPAGSITGFLRRYRETRGQKYWELIS